MNTKEEQLIKVLKNDLDEAERENTLMNEDNNVLKDELEQSQAKLRVRFCLSSLRDILNPASV